MTHETFASNAALGLTMTFAGFALGLAYFAVLRRTVSGFAAGNGRVFLSLLTLARYAAAAIFLIFAARHGALSLLLAFLGFLAARTVALPALRENGENEPGSHS
jgi:hypothetical protein